MPLTLPAEVTAMIESGGFEAHTSLDIQFGNGTVVHLSTDDITSVPTTQFGTVNYVKSLRVSGSLDQTLTVSVDRVDLSVQNIDLVMGNTVIDNIKALNGAVGTLATIFISGGTKKQVVILRGQIANASSDSNEVKFQLVSFLSLSGPVGGWRPLMLHCALRYKRTGCDSPDPSPTCSHLFKDPNGCSSKLPADELTSTTGTEGNQGRIQAFVFRSPIIIGSGIKDPQGLIDGGNDFTTYDRQNIWEGRHTLPSEYYGV